MGIIEHPTTVLRSTVIVLSPLAVMTGMLSGHVGALRVRGARLARRSIS